MDRTMRRLVLALVLALALPGSASAAVGVPSDYGGWDATDAARALVNAAVRAFPAVHRVGGRCTTPDGGRFDCRWAKGTFTVDLDRYELRAGARAWTGATDLRPVPRRLCSPGRCSDLNAWWEQEKVWRYYRGEDSLRAFTFACPAGFTFDPLGGDCWRVTADDREAHVAAAPTCPPYYRLDARAVRCLWTGPRSAPVK
jgi:hypothetical protein